MFKEACVTQKVTHEEIVEMIADVAVKQTENFLELKGDISELRREQVHMKAVIAAVTSDQASLRAEMADFRAEVDTRFTQVIDMLRLVAKKSWSSVKNKRKICEIK